MPLAVRRLAPPILAATIAASCLSSLDTSQFTIPEGAAIYRIRPQLLTFEGIDTTAGHHIETTWLTAEGMAGWNCFGLSPATPTDTVGSFVFGWVGPNTGRVERRVNGTPLDTVIGYFIATDGPGTHGTYVVHTGGALTLNWADGNRNRYFAPTAVLRLYGDTIESRADLRTRGDSVRDQWHVYWSTSATCP